MNGHCFRLALSIHDATGWPLVGVRCHGRDGLTSVIDHCGVRLDDGRFLDARGVLDGAGFVADMAEAAHHSIEPLSRLQVVALRASAYEDPEDGLSDETVAADAARLIADASECETAPVSGRR